MAKQLYLMQQAGSTVGKPANDGEAGRRFSYGAGEVVEAESGELDHVPGAKKVSAAEAKKLEEGK
jgi:hypothetical protein